jgi:hypothetical protein
MTIRFARGLQPGRKPVQVPPPSRAMLTPAAAVGDNLHLPRPGFTAQMQPLARQVDPGDLAAADVANPYKLGTMATRAEVRTQALDSPAQAAQRFEQMDTNRLNQQLQDEIHGAGSLAQVLAGPQAAQAAKDQERLMNQQMAQATGGDQTGAVADAQAVEFSARYRQGVMDERQLMAIDNLAARMASGGSAFAIGG